MNPLIYQIPLTLLLCYIKYLINTKLPNLTITTATTFTTHLIATLPSTIYHTFWNKYRRYTTHHIDRTPLQNKDIVIFVHGRNGYPTDFDPMINDLQYMIEEKYYLRSIYLGDTSFTSIEEDVEKLKEEISIYEDCSIILVGVSKGGVVVSTYFTAITDHRIKKAITISAPLFGTEIASAFPTDSKVHQALSHNNSLLLKTFQKPRSSNIYHIVPTWDTLIIPTCSAFYPTTNDKNIFHYTGILYGHNGICYSPDVIKKVAQWIQ